MECQGQPGDDSAGDQRRRWESNLGTLIRTAEVARRDTDYVIHIRAEDFPVRDFPQSTLAPGGLSLLAIWWIRLGIRPERIMPGRPDQNGQHERMHSTLKAETAKPPRTSIRSQQRAFDRFRREYNEERPHEALGQKVPTSLYTKSPRRYPSKIPEPVYPNYFKLERAYPNGVISFKNTQWYLSGCLRGEIVGLEEVSDERWKVFFWSNSSRYSGLKNCKEARTAPFWQSSTLRW